MPLLSLGAMVIIGPYLIEWDAAAIRLDFVPLVVVGLLWHTNEKHDR